MIGIIPFVYMSIGYCISLIAEYFSEKTHPVSAKKIYFAAVSGGILAIIFMLNFYNYFIVYPHTLPNGNTPFDKIIAQTIDTYPIRTDIIIVGAGWGQYAQPEVAGIPILQKTMHQESFLQTVSQAQQAVCQTPQKGQQILLIGNPFFQGQFRSTNLCLQITKSYMLTANGWNVAYVIEGTKK
jgi:hypothetical protein